MPTYDSDSDRVNEYLEAIADCERIRELLDRLRPDDPVVRQVARQLKDVVEFLE